MGSFIDFRAPQRRQGGDGGGCSPGGARHIHPHLCNPHVDQKGPYALFEAYRRVAEEERLWIEEHVARILPVWQVWLLDHVRSRFIGFLTRVEVRYPSATYYDPHWDDINPHSIEIYHKGRFAFGRKRCRNSHV